MSRTVRLSTIAKHIIMTLHATPRLLLYLCFAVNSTLIYCNFLLSMLSLVRSRLVLKVSRHFGEHKDLS